MFNISRHFSQRNNQTGLMEWFFIARAQEGVFGPFHSEKLAEQALKDFIKLNIKMNDDGGRSKNAVDGITHDTPHDKK